MSDPEIPHQEMIQELNTSDFAPNVVAKAVRNHTLPENFTITPSLPYDLEKRQISNASQPLLLW
jgi:hypothetical protein